MDKEIREVGRRICVLEDELLRCKNYKKQEVISNELTRIRKRLSKMKFEKMRNGS